MFVPDTPDAVKIYEQKKAINKDATLGSYFISAEKYETLKGFEVFPNDIIVCFLIQIRPAGFEF